MPLGLEAFKDAILSCQGSHRHSVVCLTAGPYPLPKRFFHRVGNSVSSFSFQYLVISLRSSSSYLHTLPRLTVTYNLSSIFSSLTCFRKQSQVGIVQNLTMEWFALHIVSEPDILLTQNLYLYRWGNLFSLKTCAFRRNREPHTTFLFSCLFFYRK